MWKTIQNLWADFIETISSYPQYKLYYIDECGIDKYLHREYAYSPRGAIVEGKISGKKFKRTNIVAAKCGDTIVAPMIYDGTTDCALFEHWFEYALLKSAPKCSVFIMDNAVFHRKAKLRELAQEADCDIIFLPPYSHDLNLIEHFWSWLKSRLHGILQLFDSFDDALVDCFQVR